MKLGTISVTDVAYLIKKSVDMLSEHPWINTESDAKCALYTYIYTAMAARIQDMSKCGWCLYTEYILAPDCIVDLAVLRHGEPYFLIELKHLTSISRSQIRNVEEDFTKHQQYLETTTRDDAHLLQVVTSIFNGQHKEFVESHLLTLYDAAGYTVRSGQEAVVKTMYVKVKGLD